MTLIVVKRKKRETSITFDVDRQKHFFDLSVFISFLLIFIHLLADEPYLSAGRLRSAQEEYSMLAFRALMLNKQEVLSSVKLCSTSHTSVQV